MEMHEAQVRLLVWVALGGALAWWRWLRHRDWRKRIVSPPTLRDCWQDMVAYHVFAAAAGSFFLDTQRLPAPAGMEVFFGWVRQVGLVGTVALAAVAVAVCWRSYQDITRRVDEAEGAEEVTFSQLMEEEVA